VRSAMTAPLLARGDVIGAVSFVTSGSGRVFRQSDVEMGEELGSRVAIALGSAATGMTSSTCLAVGSAWS
jgi:hypothetical protein